MSSNPGTTLARRTGVPFCLAVNRDRDLVCTRIDQHDGHCCDETAGESWNVRGYVGCPQKRDHSKEKGLVKRR